MARQLREQKDICSDLTTRVSALRQELEDAKLKVASSQMPQSMVEEVRQLVSGANSSTTQLALTMQERAHLSAAKESLTARVEELSALNHTLKAEVASLRFQSNEMMKKKVDIDVVRAELEAIKYEKLTLSTTLVISFFLFAFLSFFTCVINVNVFSV